MAEKRLRCYLVMDGEKMGHAVLSESRKKAIKHVCNQMGWCEETIEEIEIRKKFQILPKDKEGDILETEEGLLRGAYSTSGDAEAECGYCKESSEWCEVQEGRIICPKCVDKKEGEG